MDGIGGGGHAASFAPTSQRPSLFVPTGFRHSTDDAGMSPSVLSGARERRFGAEPPTGLPPSSHTTTAMLDGMDGDVVTSSFMAPIFHLTSDDSTILAMEHNNHVKLLAISSSRLELLVTNTVLMPVIENQGVETSGDDPFGTQQAPPLDVRLLDWDPAEHSVLVDRLRAPCTQLLWGPWQHGTYLGALSPGCFLHMYRYSHGRWALDASLPAEDCIAFAFSCHFTVACACTNGAVQLYARGSAAVARVGAAAPPLTTERAPPQSQPSVLGGDTAASASAPETGLWTLTGQFHTAASPSRPDTNSDDDDEKDDEGSTWATPQPDCLSVSFDEHGQLVVAGYADGSVRVFRTTHGSSRPGPQVFLHQHEAAALLTSPDPCRQVTWAPSAGRSFLMLALVYPHRVSLVLFRRPLLAAKGSRDGAGDGGGAASEKLDSTAGGGGGKARGTALPSSRVKDTSCPLTVIATATVTCEEVAKLSWNTTGTRFVTSHTDSLVQAWVVQVAYKQDQIGGDTQPLSRESGQLHLAVSMKKISTVHPYHATGTR